MFPSLRPFPQLAVKCHPLTYSFFPHLLHERQWEECITRTSATPSPYVRLSTLNEQLNHLKSYFLDKNSFFTTLTHLQTRFPFVLNTCRFPALRRPLRSLHAQRHNAPSACPPASLIFWEQPQWAIPIKSMTWWRSIKRTRCREKARDIILKIQCDSYCPLLLVASSREGPTLGWLQQEQAPACPSEMAWRPTLCIPFSNIYMS